MSEPIRVQETASDSEEEYYRCHRNREFKFYSPRDIKVVGIHGKRNTGLKVTVIFLLSGRDDSEPGKTAVYPLSQAQDLFEDVLARYIHTHRKIFCKASYPEFEKYMNYEAGQYPVSAVLNRYYETRK